MMRLFLVLKTFNILVVIAIVGWFAVYMPWQEPTTAPILANSYEATFDARKAIEFYFVIIFISLGMLPILGCALYAQFLEGEQNLARVSWSVYLGSLSARLLFFIVFSWLLWIYIASIFSIYKQSQFSKLPQSGSISVNDMGIRVPFSIIMGDSIFLFDELIKGDMISNNQGVIFIPWEQIAEWVVNPRNTSLNRRDRSSPTYEITLNPEALGNAFTNKLYIDRERIRKHDEVIIEMARKNLVPNERYGIPGMSAHPLILKDKPLDQNKT